MNKLLRTCFDWFSHGLLPWLCLVVLLASSVQAHANPGDILFQDDFERSNPGSVGNGWVVTPANTDSACQGVSPTLVSGETFPVATITIAGSQKVPVNGITVAGQQIMAASYGGSTSITGGSGVAAKIAERINSCTSAITGNCTVAGYSASRSGSSVIITGPATATGVPSVSLGTPSGTGTTETFSVTTFTAYAPAVYTYTAATNTGCAGIDSDVPPWNRTALPLAPRANTNSKAMFTRWSTVTVDSPVINLAGKPAVQVTFWVRRGSDCFSEWPGNNSGGCNAVLAPFTSLIGEEFQVQYKNNAGAWLVLSQYPTDAVPGEIFRPVIDLPADALWSGFQLRFSQPGGSGSGGSGGAPNVRGYDHWHLDDVKVTEMSATPYSGGFCDTFEGDLSRWTFIGNGNAAIGSTYFQNGAHDLDIRWGPVTVTSKPSDVTGVTDNISFWIKRGIGAVTKVPNTTGSDQPGTGHNLEVEYLTTTAGVWKALVPAATFTGAGTGGQVWCPVLGTNCPAASVSANTSITIPADANRTAFQFRFKLLGGAGYDRDYWHLDDICVGKVVTGTDLSLSMLPTGTTTLAPGATSTITFTVTNLGPNVEPGAITVTDTLPAGLSFVSSGSWSSGTWPLGLTGCTTVGQVLTCTRSGSLAVGASTTLTITVQADSTAAGTNLSNVAVVGGQSLEIAAPNNTATNFYSFSVAAFEAYETTTSPTSAIIGRIFTKLAGTPFNLKVIAINAGVINSAYNKAATVDLIDGSAACVAGTAALTGTSVTPTPYTYIVGDGGVHTFAFTSSKAYAAVRVRIKDNTALSCSSDNFAIRPSAATLVTTASATAPSSVASPAFKAGANFTLQATTSVSASYGGTLVLDTAKLTAQNPVQDTTKQAGGTIGTLTPGALTANAAAVNATYTEVGYVYLAPGAYRDDSFTDIDSESGDCVTSTVSDANLSDVADGSGKFGCSIGNKVEVSLGRFYPDRFETSVIQTGTAPAITPMTCPIALTCPSNASDASGMVYSGQPFPLQITAKNGVGAGATTLNYQGSFAKAVALKAVAAVGSASLNPGGGTLASTALLASDFASGSLGVLPPNRTYTLPAYVSTPAVSPTDFYVRAYESTGSDGVTSLQTVAASSKEAGLKVAYGRVSLPNVYGSDLLPAMCMTASVQYFTGAFWTVSATDNASTVALATPVIVKGPLTTLTQSFAANSSSACPVGNDACGLTGAGMFCAGQKYIRLEPAGVAGSANIALTVPSYLPSTSGSATFGVYKSPLIYRRENY